MQEQASIYIETFGCQMNVADSERAATSLRDAGYQLSSSAENADVVLLNTCSVRERAAQKLFNRIGEVRRARRNREPLFGVMGCVAQLEGTSIFERAPAVTFVVGTRATDKLPTLIKEVLEGKRGLIDLTERDEPDTWQVDPLQRHSRHIAFVPIIEGCNKFCSYCIVPYSRGREKSRPATEVIRQLRRLRGDGFREVHLIGQNVNSYRPKVDDGLEGFSGATYFSRLLRAVAATGVERIKFTTSFPRDFHADIVNALDENENLCNWIHLPVQSGSDRLLRQMRRGYRVSDYMQRVDTIKNARRRLSLTSDIIVGFPGETTEDFDATLRLVQECRYDGLYIFKYSERPGTPAARLEDDVNEKVKTERFLTLERLQRSIQSGIYEKYLGADLDVLVERTSAKSAEHVVGHSTCHKVVNFKGGINLRGHVVRVRITEVKANSLFGVVRAAA